MRPRLPGTIGLTLLRSSRKNKLPSSVEEEMPGPTSGYGGGGWCAVFLGEGSNHRDSGAHPLGLVPASENPPASPPLSKGAPFSSNVAPQCGMKDSLGERGLVPATFLLNWFHKFTNRVAVQPGGSLAVHHDR